MYTPCISSVNQNHEWRVIKSSTQIDSIARDDGQSCLTFHLLLYFVCFLMAQFQPRFGLTVTNANMFVAQIPLKRVDDLKRSQRYTEKHTAYDKDRRDYTSKNGTMLGP